MITHDEAKECISRLFDSYIHGDFIPFPTRSDLDTIRLYISQQEKVTQLLKLYERLSYYSKYDVFDKETRERVSELKDDISQLKKELGEMK